MPFSRKWLRVGVVRVAIHEARFIEAACDLQSPLDINL